MFTPDYCGKEGGIFKTYPSITLFSIIVIIPSYQNSVRYLKTWLKYLYPRCGLFGCLSAQLIKLPDHSENVPSSLALVNYFLRHWMDFWLEWSDLAISSLPALTAENSLWNSFHGVFELICHCANSLLSPKLQAMPDKKDWCLAGLVSQLQHLGATKHFNKAVRGSIVPKSKTLVAHNDLLVNTASEQGMFFCCFFVLFVLWSSCHQLIFHIAFVRVDFQSWMRSFLSAHKHRKTRSSNTLSAGDVITVVFKIDEHCTGAGLFSQKTFCHGRKNTGVNNNGGWNLFSSCFNCSS